MKEIIKSAAEEYFHLTEMSMERFSELKGRGMRFLTKVFDAENTGRLCIMDMKAVAGLMRMETGVFSPVGRDGPIFSFEYIKAAGKETLLVELYDTTISHPDFAGLGEIKKRYAQIPAYDPGEHWYDAMRLPVSDFKRGRQIAGDLSHMLEDYCKGYFRLLDGCTPCDPEEKKKCNAVFADGLLTNGGPAVDTFKKMIGNEDTGEFLRRYMFYCR